MAQALPVVLTIAGFDPSSGAGVTADIKTITAHGCYGVAAITAMTVQSTVGVRRVSPVDARLLLDTVEELAADLTISAVHIGMLGSGEVAKCLAQYLERAQLPNIVLDPILTSSSGAAMLDKSGIEILKGRLLSLVAIVTPNVDEAWTLSGVPIHAEADMGAAASRLHELGAHAVVVTGGHLPEAVDLLSIQGQPPRTFRSERIPSRNTHGTGCAFSTALACQLALGKDVLTAVPLAKSYVTAAIAQAQPLGKGVGPIHHMYGMKECGFGS